MPVRDPAKIQLDFPQLVFDFIKDLKIIGQVGLVDFVPTVQPVYLMGQREGVLTVNSADIAFTPAEILSNFQTAPALNTVLLDTAALPAGTYDIRAILSYANNGNPAANGQIQLQHRNAANAANLSSIPFPTLDLVGNTQNFVKEIRYATVLALNERLRWQQTTAASGGQVATVIMAHRRTSP